LYHYLTINGIGIKKVEYCRLLGTRVEN